MRRQFKSQFKAFFVISIKNNVVLFDLGRCLYKLHFILSYEAGFYKPTIFKAHPSICGITAHATKPGYLSTMFLSSFDQNETYTKKWSPCKGLKVQTNNIESCHCRPRLLTERLQKLNKNKFSSGRYFFI